MSAPLSPRPGGAEMMSDPIAPADRTVAILGGGLSGAAVAWHLAAAAPGLRILVIEPRAALGAGLAYGTADPAHRLNVPDIRMTLRSDIPDHYAQWLNGPCAPERRPGDETATGHRFTPRATFARYVAAQLAPDLTAGRIHHLRAAAVGVAERSGRALITLSDGTQVAAEAVVLAISHPKPALPAELAPLAADARLIADPLAPGAIDGIGLNERILIVGAGLTASDVVASLDRRGFAGHVTMISRHGWRSRPHGPVQPETTADFTTDPATTARDLLRRVRRALAEDAAQGLTWHAVFDRLRAQGPAIWAALDETERRRFLRHLRSLWDVHRFRIAPQTAEAAARLEAAGRLVPLAARLVAVDDGAPLQVRLRPRGTQTVIERPFDRIVVATGPNHRDIIPGTPVLAALAGLGVITSDPLRLGIATNRDGTAQPVPGAEPSALSGRVFVAGPLARATVGELMGVPEVVTWAEHVARAVARAVGRDI